MKSCVDIDLTKSLEQSINVIYVKNLLSKYFSCMFWFDLKHTGETGK